MPSSASVVLAEFVAEAASGRSGGARVFTARSQVPTAQGTSPFARLVVAATAASAPGDLNAELARASHYAYGVWEVSQAVGAAWLPAPSLGASSVVVGFRASVSRTLDDALGAGERLDADAVADLLRRIAAGLGALHDQGVAHGQLRADLVALAPPGAPVLEGFGLGPLLSRLGGLELARAAQPAEYRAPELSSGEPRRPDPAADIFALGVLVSELLGRRRAHAGARLSPRALGAAVSDELEALVATATAPVAADRPDSVRDWSERVAARIAVELPAAEPPREESAHARLPEAAPASVPSASVRNTAADSPPLAEPPPSAGAPFVAPPLEAPVPKAAPVYAPGMASTEAAPRGTPIAMIVFVLLGGLLMCGGISALFGYRLMTKRMAVHVATSASVGFGSPPPPAASSSSPANPFVLPSGSAPTPAVPEPDESEPDEEPDDSLPVLPDKRTSSLSPEDALAPLPLDASVPLWGAHGAPVTVVVFGDLECPHTRKMLGVLSRLKASFKDELRLAFRHRPLPAHGLAKNAAEVTARVHIDAGDSAFWAMLEQASASSSAPSDAELFRWRSGSSSSLPDAASLRSTPAAVSRVARDLSLAGQFNVRATPTLFINGLRVEGEQPFADLKRAVSAERKLALASLATGTRRPELYAARTKKNLINVGADVIQRTCPNVAGSPLLGATPARVTVVEFSDFECEYCKQVQPALTRLLARYGKDVRLVWKNFPLEQHEHAHAAAALAAHVFDARGSGAFWKVHDQLFKLSPALDEPALLIVAKREGLTAEVARELIARAQRNPRIARDVALGERLGVTGTPTFFVNGRRITGARSLGDFQRLVDEELESARRLIAAGTDARRVYEVLCAGS